jgi:hypothetical protein
MKSPGQIADRAQRKDARNCAAPSRGEGGAKTRFCFARAETIDASIDDQNRALFFRTKDFLSGAPAHIELLFLRFVMPRIECAFSAQRFLCRLPWDCRWPPF